MATGMPDGVTTEEVFAFLRRFGRNTNSFVLAYGGFDWFRSDDPPGLVAYASSGRTCVVGGDPLCAPEDTPAVMRAFARHVGVRRRLAVIMTSSWTLPSLKSLGFGAICVGSDPFFDLDTWGPRGDRGKPVRSAANRARRRGVTVSTYEPVRGRDLIVEAELRACVDAWLAGRQGFPMRFFSAVRPLEFADQKRYYCAWQEGRMAAFVACSPIYARNGWLVEDIVRRPDAASGVTEVLVKTAFQSLRRHGFKVATLGLSVFENPPADGAQSGRMRTLRAVGAALGPFYNFGGMRHYRKKFVPSSWEPVYVAFRPDRLSPALVLGVLNALVPGGLAQMARVWVRSRLSFMS